ncbi:small GTPase superfamily [Fomitopsis betulina]|nr:small GTPase superfamily [Fomitopsis betulina]
MRKFNCVVLGAGGVGKSALTIRYGKNVFIEQYNPTIEEEYRCEPTVDGHKCVLEIIDTPGTEQFTALNEKYLKNARGYLLVFSLSQESSLRDIDTIRQQIYSTRGTDKDVPIVVVGTKLDLSNEREVSRATIHELAESWKLPFYETSAKRNWHVTDVFEDLIRQMRKHYPDKHPVRSKLKKDPCTIM